MHAFAVANTDDLAILLGRFPGENRLLLSG